MFKSRVVESWARLAPFENSEDGALEYYRRMYAESSTKIASGRWAIAALKKHLPTRVASARPISAAVERGEGGSTRWR